MKAYLLATMLLITTVPAAAQDQSSELQAIVAKATELSGLTQPGSQPFHLKLEVADTYGHPEFTSTVEMWWAAPDTWRREIKSSVFTQTAIQSGQHYSESNSPDYLPWWLHNVIGETLDPVPSGEVEAARPKIDESAAGGCFKWNDIFREDADEIGISNSICFNPNHTLKTVFLRTAAAQFSDYRPFGRKEVARLMESWTKTSDFKNVNLKSVVTVLEPLKESGSLFTINQDTGLSSRTRFITVSNAELQAAKLDAPPLQWPVIHNFPSSGLMTVNLKIDRQGNVREVESPISHNVVLSDSAREQLQKWKFKPFLVDGAPVQVSADIVFKFQARMMPYGAKGADIPEATSLQRINKSRTLSDLHTENNKPFHLRATFQFTNGSIGSYDEIWVAPTKWRREATLGKMSVTESQDGDRLYRKFAGSDFSPRRIDDFLDELDSPLPRTDGSFQEGDWGQSAVEWNGSDMLRVARGQVDANNVPITGQAYWFDSGGVLRGAFVAPRLRTYSDFSEWNGKQVPYKTEVTENGAVILNIALQQIEPLASSSDVAFAIEGVTPQPVVDPENYTGPRVVLPKAILRVKPSDPHAGHGKVLVDVYIDKHGHVRSARVTQSAGDVLDAAAVQAAIQWEFEPAALKGRIIPMNTTLTFEF